MWPPGFRGSGENVFLFFVFRELGSTGKIIFRDLGSNLIVLGI